MQHLYIDESGSMTTQYSNNWPYFVIAIIRTDNPDKLRRLYTRFTKKFFSQLKSVDKDGKMFSDDTFEELKGSAFTPSLKKSFISFFGRKGTLDAYFIVIDNKKISNILYSNTARAFNYVLKLALEYFIKKDILPDDSYIIQLDERNERTDSKHFLQDYLNTELRMEGVLSQDISVEYFDSSKNKIIQIADVFANLYYSQLLTSNYSEEIALLHKNQCLKSIFRFPLG